MRCRSDSSIVGKTPMRVGASFARSAEATDSRWMMRVGASWARPACDRAARLDRAERGDELLGILIAVGRILGQRLVDQRLPVLLRGRQARNRLEDVRIGDGEAIGPFVGWLSGQAEPGQHAEAIEIRARIDIAAARLFRDSCSGWSRPRIRRW